MFVLHVGGNHVEDELVLLAVVVEQTQVGVLLEQLDFEVVEGDGPQFGGLVEALELAHLLVRDLELVPVHY